MARTLIETKFYSPAVRASLVARPRLAAQLEHGAGRALTLISAPAGFGKTTLLAEWARAATAAGRPIGWLSLGPDDNDPATFWTYVAKSLHRANPNVATAARLLAAAEAPPIASVLTALVNDLSTVDGDITLVLDDYHVITAPEIAEQMASFVGLLPPGAHIAITTRADPAFPLARLRARGELTEVRAADLRFTNDEATAYLNGVAELGLRPADISTLEERTEGWIAALQLAALSIQGRDDASDFIASFAGDDRFVVDLLVEEVLDRQTDDVRAFLLQTSILDRLTAPLADAVTGQDDGRATLEALDRGNLFVVPLDSARRWYRYHHLFAEVLRARLLSERPATVAELHRRAGEWLERHGDRTAAIRHALAGEDWEKAADLIELAVPDLRQARQEATMRRLFASLPPATFGSRPVLAIGYVGALMANGEFHEIDGLLDGAERWLDPGSPRSEMRVADDGELDRLPSAIAMYRAAQAQIRGDRDATMAHAQRALELAGDDDPLARGGAAGFLALAHWADGDLEAAHAHWSDAMASLERAGHTVDALAIVRALAEIRAAQGRLGDARRAYERGLERATAHEPPLRGAADMHTGLAELALEANDLDAAAGHLLVSAELDERGAGLPQNAYRRRVAAALVRLAEGDAGAAMGLLDDAEAAFVGEYFPILRPIPALRARFALARGRLADAVDWATERGLAPDDVIDHLHEFEYVTLARIQLAQGAQSDAIGLLERLLPAAEGGGRVRSVIERLVLLALAHHALDDDARARTSLRRALVLGQPEGYVRSFIGEGAPMVAMLEAALAHGISPDYVRRLLAAANRPRRQPLADPLSERELDVLRLLATDRSGPDIAAELVVGLSTVRSHTKSIYAKLDVNGRRAAVSRAAELGLLDDTLRR